MKKLLLISVLLPLAYMLSCNKEKEPINQMKPQQEATANKVLHAGIQNVYWNNQWHDTGHQTHDDLYK